MPSALTLMLGFFACAHNVTISSCEMTELDDVHVQFHMYVDHSRPLTCFFLRAGHGIPKNAQEPTRFVQRAALADEIVDNDPQIRSKLERDLLRKRIVSSVLTTFTDAAFFKRMSGGLGQIYRAA